MENGATSSKTPAATALPTNLFPYSSCLCSSCRSLVHSRQPNSPGLHRNLVHDGHYISRSGRSRRAHEPLRHSHCCDFSRRRSWSGLRARSFMGAAHEGSGANRSSRAKPSAKQRIITCLIIERFGSRRGSHRGVPLCPGESGMPHLTLDVHGKHCCTRGPRSQSQEH
jgi:hypothetical protein